MSVPSPAPLAGLTVLELGQIYNGPYCALLLAHHGAEVIKIEAPQGDVLRRMDRSPGGAPAPNPPSPRRPPSDKTPTTSCAECSASVTPSSPSCAAWA